MVPDAKAFYDFTWRPDIVTSFINKRTSVRANDWMSSHHLASDHQRNILQCHFDIVVCETSICRSCSKGCVETCPRSCYERKILPENSERACIHFVSSKIACPSHVFFLFVCAAVTSALCTSPCLSESVNIGPPVWIKWTCSPCSASA